MGKPRRYRIPLIKYNFMYLASYIVMYIHNVQYVHVRARPCMSVRKTWHPCKSARTLHGRARPCTDISVGPCTYSSLLVCIRMSSASFYGKFPWLAMRIITVMPLFFTQTVHSPSRWSTYCLISKFIVKLAMFCNTYSKFELACIEDAPFSPLIQQVFGFTLPFRKAKTIHII